MNNYPTFKNLGVKKEQLRKFQRLPIEIVKDQVKTQVKTNHPILYKTSMRAFKNRPLITKKPAIQFA